MNEMSKNRQWLRSWLGFELFLTMALIMSVAVLPAQGGSPPASAGEGSMSYKTPYVVLSGEFFQAMEKLAGQHGCSAIHTLVHQSDTAPQQAWITDLLEAHGHKPKRINLCKSLAAVG